MAQTIHRILAPVDFSDCSRTAVEFAASLSAKLGAKFDMLHVWDAPPYIPVDAVLGVGTDTVGAWAVQTAREALATFTQELHAAGIEPGQTFVRFGPIASTIAEIADSEGYDLIVLGTQGRTGLARWVVGSVAERVVRLARCPVISVPAKGATHAEPGR